MIFLGIDPGAKGAVGIVGERCEVIDCPKTYRQVVNLVGELAEEEIGFCYVEQVNPFYRSSAKSAFAFGANYYTWLASLHAFDIRYETILPHEWQTISMGKRKRTLSQNKTKRSKELKERSVRHAESFYPGIQFRSKKGVLWDGRSDAILIAKCAEEEYYAKARRPRLQRRSAGLY